MNDDRFDDTLSTTPPSRRGSPLQNLAWLLAGALLAVFLVVDPFGIHPVDGWIHDLAHRGETAHGGGEAEAQTLWTCGMHPEVIEDEPGTCPICHMDLTPMKASAPETSGGGAVVTIDPAVVQNMNVLTESVERTDLRHEIRTVGYLDYDQEKMISVTTKYPGFVERVFVNYVGEPVRKGQALFEIYSPELVQTQEELLSARAFAARLTDAPEEARERAGALAEAARRRLGYWDVGEDQIRELEERGSVERTLTVRAPSSGLVMKRMPGLEGMAVRPGMELFHIADLSSLWLNVEVFEDQLPWLREGSEAEVELAYFPGERFRGRVRFVEPQVAEKTRTVGLRVEVPNRDGRLRAGMYATVRFDPVVRANAVAVPSRAILRTGERDVVVVALGGGRFEPREVRLGAEGDGRVEILSGLAAGEEIVTSSQFLIDSESNLQEAVQKLLAARRAKGLADPESTPPAPGHAGHAGH